MTRRIHQLLFMATLALGGVLPSPVARAHETVAARPEARLHTVIIRGNRFFPASLTIRRGDSVQWLNRSRVVHTVTADPARATRRSHFKLPPGVNPFHSGNILPGWGHGRTFLVAGAYKYFCVPHQDMGMLGKILVLP